MPLLEPFAGLRYARDRVALDDVVAPPYDVISEEDQAALEARSPYNSVRVELPRDDPPRDRYQAARARLDEWRATRILVRDSQPVFYAYRMRFEDGAGRARETLGVIGALGLEPPGEGDLLPHERTTPKPKGDRLYLLRAAQTNLSPIWGLSLATGLSTTIPQHGPDVMRCTDEDGVIHESWALAEPEAIEAIKASIASAPIVIADGHHRFETAVAYQEERRAANGGQQGEFDLVMALIVEATDDHLSVGAIHRLLRGLPDGFDLVTALSPWLELIPTTPPDATVGDRMIAAGALALVTADGTWLARPWPELERAAPQPLDSSRLDIALATLPDHEVVYQHGWDRATAAVAKGDAQAAVLLRPASVAQIAATGRGGERMPPKTTFFWPKPRTGIVFREVMG